MGVKNLKYVKGSEDMSEAVEFDVYRGGEYAATAFTDKYRLQARADEYTCKNGGYIVLEKQEMLEIAEFMKGRRDAISKADKIKSMDSWWKSGLGMWEEYARVGDLVGADVVEYFAICVPPLVLKEGFLQCGEVADYEYDEEGKWHGTYITFVYDHIENSRGVWKYCGECFQGETEDKGKDKTQLDWVIEDYRLELDAGKKIDGD